MTYQNKKYGPTKTAPKKSKRKWWVASLLVVLILGLGFGAYWQFFRTKPVVQSSSATAETKGESSTNTPSTTGKPSADTNNSGGAVGSNGQTTSPSDQKAPPTSGASPLVPTGDFVSSHGANQPVPRSAAMESVCTSTPGASCVISFTQGNVTKSLPAQTTDKGGSTYWNQWTPQSYGLTAGSWTITATATLNGQTKSATDALPLKVAP